MSLRRANSTGKYAEWVKQAVFEVGDLRDCMMYELEDMTRFPAFLEPLEAGIRGIYDAMREGRYSFGREDLPFMDIAAPPMPARSPFTPRSSRSTIPIAVAWMWAMTGNNLPN